MRLRERERERERRTRGERIEEERRDVEVVKERTDFF